MVWCGFNSTTLSNFVVIQQLSVRDNYMAIINFVTLTFELWNISVCHLSLKCILDRSTSCLCDLLRQRIFILFDKILYVIKHIVYIVYLYIINLFAGFAGPDRKSSIQIIHFQDQSSGPTAIFCLFGDQQIE